MKGKKGFAPRRVRKESLRPLRLGAKHSVAIYPDKPQLVEAAADRFIEAVENAVEEAAQGILTE
ncbi:MAG: hypothetical protein V3T83_04070 [Acidobacteriota bacterium]